MTQIPSTCPKCQGPFEKGYIADLAYGSIMQSSWTAGEPVPRRFFQGIKWKQDANTPIVTYCCQNCGYLESYAPRT